MLMSRVDSLLWGCVHSIRGLRLQQRGIPSREACDPRRDAVLPRSLPRGIPPLILIVLMIEEIVLIVFVSILNGVIQGEDVLFLVVLPFIEAF